MLGRQLHAAAARHADEASALRLAAQGARERLASSEATAAAKLASAECALSSSCAVSAGCRADRLNLWLTSVRYICALQLVFSQQRTTCGMGASLRD